MQTPNYQQAFINIQKPHIVVTNLSEVSSTPLNNMRLAVKDLFDVKGIATSAGNPDWLRTHALASNTNSTVATLLANGALYQGKTLTDELAYSLNGQNVHFPQLINPVTPERIAGGSSSGSAVAVSANLADIGLGTDTGGSIRVPASYNGLFGLRTSHGILTCDNMVPLAPSFDTIGWMCKDIETLEKVAQTVLPAASNSNNKDLNASVKPLTFCLANNLLGESEQAAEINLWTENLASTAHSVERVDIDTSTHKISKTFRTLQGYEIWQQHGQWILQTQPSFGSDIQQRFDWCKNITEHEYEIAQKQQTLFCHYIKKCFQRYDLIIIPTTPGRAPLLDMAASKLSSYRNNLLTFTAIAGLAGLPQIHLPLFRINGAPCGLSLIAPKNQDLRLIHIAKTLMDLSI